MIFNLNNFSSSSSGQGALNFKVVGGTTEPVSPKENTIWVNTDTEITDWAFSNKNPYIGYQDINLMDGMTLGNGYFSTSGSISSQTGNHKEVYTNNYISVKYGVTYTWEYKISTTQQMWLNIVEYTGSYTFKKYLLPVSYVNGTYQTGTYTPSDSSVTAVRLSWSTFSDTTCEVKFIELDVVSTTEEPEAGVVWISTGTSSPVEFNALKDHNITVCPISAKQYISNEWVDKTAKSYQNGEWVDWITYMYNKGDQCTDLTGGWLSYGYKAKITFNNDHMLLGIESGYNEIYGMAYTANKIDVSNMNTLYFYIDERTSTDITESSNNNDKYSTVGISTSPDVSTNGWVAYARVPANTSQTLFSVDVSTYDGTYYVCMLNAVNVSGHMKCSQVYGM